ncbi:MAG: extracellular solute-binding protein, partial [Spirochaetaceae bacterium]
MKKVVIIAMILAMAVPALSVIAGGKKEAGVADRTELRMAWWGSQRRHDMTIGAIELYMQKNPNVNITYEFAGWGDYWTMLTTQAAGGNLPDIVQHDYQYLAEWAGRGQLLGLNQFVESGALDLSNVEDDAIAGGKLDGELYGVNIGSNATTFVIDVDMFDAAGIPIPDWEWTWQDFERIAQQLHNELGVWAIGGNLQNWHVWNQIYISLGQSAYAPDGRDLGYTNDQPFIDHLNMILRLQEAGVVPHISEWLAVYDDAGVEQQPIVAGDAAMAFVWSNQLIAMWRAAGEDRNFVLRPVPRVAGGASSVYVKPGQFLAVSARSGAPDAAVAFV